MNLEVQNMEKRLKLYLLYLKDRALIDLPEDEKAALKEDLLIQIPFFQHERFIHLVVTVTFALLAFAALFLVLFYESLGNYLLLAFLLVLLIPYIRHYYILENGVQKLYGYYDKLK
jgi:hypothetical protein